MNEERVERRLAAILAADIAGYSRLMGADEEGTLAALKALRRDLIDPKVTAHRGRIVKTTGDGTLIEFASVVDAVRCSVEIQREMAERNSDVSAAKRIEFRIGINVGDIIIDEGDIYGDSVNVAARLEALAEPGGICISATAYDQVRAKLPLTFVDMGEQQLRNIDRSVRFYAISIAKERLLGNDGAALSQRVFPASNRRRNPYFRMRNSLVFFDERFSEAFPGKRGAIVVSDSEKACTYLLQLLRKPLAARHSDPISGANFETHPIWWWRGLQNNSIGRVRRIGAGTLLMDYFELEINYIIAFAAEYYKHRFVYVQVKAQPSTGLYGDELAVRDLQAWRSYAREEYAIYKGQIFTRAEYDDNGAERDGRYIRFNGKAALRVRSITPYNFLIASQHSPINDKNSDLHFQEMLDSILRGKSDPKGLEGYVSKLGASVAELSFHEQGGV